MQNNLMVIAEQSRSSLCASFASLSKEKPFAFVKYSYMNNSERVEFNAGINQTLRENNIPQINPESIKEFLVSGWLSNDRSAEIFSSAVHKAKEDMAYCLNVDQDKIDIQIVSIQDPYEGFGYRHCDQGGDYGIRLSMAFIGKPTQFFQEGLLECPIEEEFYDSAEHYVEAAFDEISIFRMNALHRANECNGENRLLALVTCFECPHDLES